MAIFTIRELIVFTVRDNRKVKFVSVCHRYTHRLSSYRVISLSVKETEIIKR